MSVKLWSISDSIDVEGLVLRNNLNRIKIILYPIDEGYEVFMKINDKEESMYFTYQDTRILDSLDYGMLPTTILSGICQSKEQYLYSNYVFAEVIDQRYNHSNITFKVATQSSIPETKLYTIMRLTDNCIQKLTGVKSRCGDLREEQQWISKKMSQLNFDSSNYNEKPGNTIGDGFDFVNNSWFIDILKEKHVSVIHQKKSTAKWNNITDGPFRPDYLHRIQHNNFKEHLKKELFIDKYIMKKKYLPNNSLEIREDMFDKISKQLEHQKNTIFKMSPIPTIKLSECSEECVHQMIIRSPLSGSNFKLILSRCTLHNRHWGHLIVDQWEGSSTKPIRFELPGGHGQGRRLLNQLSEMLGARMPVNVEPNVSMDIGFQDHNVGQKINLSLEQASIPKSNMDDRFWESIESIMSKNIQTGKPLFDNRESFISIDSNDFDVSDIKRRKMVDGTKMKVALGNQESIKNESILRTTYNFEEPQQKQSLYSLKDLNLDDLF